MQAKLIDIGTSKGIRIPSSILKSFDTLPTKFDIQINKCQIILNIKDNPRANWKSKFQTPNELLIDDNLDLKDLDEL